jgi:hypothetical protein
VVKIPLQNRNESCQIQVNRGKSSSESSRVGDRRSLPAPDAPASGARLSACRADLRADLSRRSIAKAEARRRRKRAAPANQQAQVLPKRRRHPFAGRTLRLQIAARQSPPSVPSRYRAMCTARTAHFLPRQQETGGPWSVVRRPNVTGCNTSVTGNVTP